MKNPKIKIARDGKVTFFSVYEQRWVCIYADIIMDRDLATLTSSERARIARAAEKVNR